MFCDFDGFHASAEAHCSVCLGDTSGHATRDTADEVIGSEGFGVEFGFGGYEEEDGTFCGSFDPGPWDETLVV